MGRRVRVGGPVPRCPNPGPAPSQRQRSAAAFVVQCVWRRWVQQQRRGEEIDGVVYRGKELLWKREQLERTARQQVVGKVPCWGCCSVLPDPYDCTPAWSCNVHKPRPQMEAPRVITGTLAKISGVGFFLVQVQACVKVSPIVIGGLIVFGRNPKDGASI